MAQVIMSIEEYKQTENRLTAIGELKEKVRSSGVFEDSTSCWQAVGTPRMTSSDRLPWKKQRLW